MELDPVNPKNTNGNSNSGSLSELTQEKATKSNAIEIPSISLPKGGGALKGIDDKFQVNSANGTAGFNIPLPLSPGRNGFAPSLALSYNSGSGNSPYGLGWSVGYPSIQRKTDKKLPRYREGLDEDIFMFSGAEDLVPYLEEETPGKFKRKEKITAEGFTVTEYRPRIEGGFSRIEKIIHTDSGTYWKVTTRDNTVTFFGRNQEARISDPLDPTHIFEWLPEFSYDNKGNWIQYHYKNDSNLNSDGTIKTDDSIPNHLYEKNRKSGVAAFTNTYLKRLTYGNRNAFYPGPNNPYNPIVPVGAGYFFEMVMDYGEHTNELQLHIEVNDWIYREDPFSSYRSGFEIRTNRLCKRVLMFHHFQEEKQILGYEDDGTKIQTDFGENYLVRSLKLNYEPSSINGSVQTETTYLKSIVQTGFIRKGDGTYSKKSLPPLEFTYETLNWNTEIKTVSEANIMNAPVGLANNYQWVDLYGEGIAGILTEQGEGWYYKSNLGDIDEDGEAAFSAAQKVAPKPSFMGLSNGTLSLRDLAANGEKQLVIESPSIKGFFELTDDNDWKPFKPFESIANIDLQNPNVRMFDINGDGQPELVMTEENVFAWYAADGKRGHLPAEFAQKTFDEERGPAIVFADLEQTLFLADMSGDGLTDIVRIRNGEICYWANMGNGKFSAKINMGNAPVFDHPDPFNPQYLHLADVSGTGATDIIYLGKNKFEAFINLSGNAWSEPHLIDPFPHVDSNTRLSVVDLLGTGTTCIVWSSDLPANANMPMKYVDLMDSKKPHVMTKYVNNMGMETSMEYKSSTYYYLKDKAAGRPWVTKLPFPVQVISKQIVEEKITDVRFTSEFNYHHGYFDHPEREFRGFGMVEQIDTETFEEWEKNNVGNQLEKSEVHYQKPVLTKTWFHTGAFFDRERILSQFKEDYWFEEYNRLFPEEPINISEPELEDAHLKLASTIQDQNLLALLSVEEWREALRACKGMTLRSEVFALDANPDDPQTFKTQAKPYAVTTQNCHIQLLQPKQKNEFAVFMVTQSEGLSIQYERNEDDPRITHSLNVKIDDLGNVLESASVVYPRNMVQAQTEFDFWRNRDKNFGSPQEEEAFQKSFDFIQSEQTEKTHIVYSQASFTNEIINDSNYLLRVPSEAKTFELTALPKAGERYQLLDFNTILDTGSSLLEYHETPSTVVVQRRIIEHIRNLYYDENLEEALPLGELASHGIPFESYQLAYTPALIQQIYGDKIADQEATFGDLGKYVHTEGDDNWWIRSGTTQFFDSGLGEDLETVKTRFFSPISFTDPLSSLTKVAYYKDYFLFIERTQDALDNEVRIENFDFRILSPTKTRDINDNLSEVLVDELGSVKASALLGKDLDLDGIAELEQADTLNGLEAISENEDALIQSFFETNDSDVLHQLGRALLKESSGRMLYNFGVYQSNGKPTVAASIAREMHHQHLSPGEETKLQISFEYSDGGGNVVMAKAQAEPGQAKKTVINPDGSVLITDEDTGNKLRWIGNGRTVLNNKGNPVKQYEPYFSVTPFFEDDPELVERGVTPILYYDSLDRNIRIELPDRAFSKTEFDAWKQLSYDTNDTVKDSLWFTERVNRLIDVELEKAGKDPIKEKTAAEKAAKHYDTPSVVFMDNLGRPVLSLAHNRNLNDEDEFYSTRILLDIEGNPKQVIDARDNTVMNYEYDMLGHRVNQTSMDAGERWSFNDVIGNPILSWDERNHIFQTSYDELHRPLDQKVSGGDGAAPLDNIYAKSIYGESLPDSKQKNFRGQVIIQYDTAGKVENETIDLKGNMLKTNRRFALDYKSVVDWNGPNLDAKLEAEEFTAQATYDALDRLIEGVSPDNSISQPTFNEAGLLETVTITQNGISELFVKSVDYDEKRQRKSIIYGNNVKTTYTYDKDTFRLTQLISRRQNNSLLQDLHYTYDPVGNISEIEDKSLQTTFFANFMAEPKSIYHYDALYRLTEAKGREQIAQIDFGIKDNNDDRVFMKNRSSGDPMAIRSFTQKYKYDAVGNIDQMNHSAIDGNWTRNYNYEDQNNRLTTTKIGTTTYQYPHHAEHGFITALPHLDVMQWNFKEELQAIAKQKMVGGIPETTYYVYDGAGQRARKITEMEGGNQKKEERYYLGDVEVYRKHQQPHLGLERSTLHISDDSGRIAMIDTRNAINDNTDQRTVRYQMGNHLGSVALETNENAEVITYEEYHPYGTTAYQAKNEAIKATAKRYRYTGMERDEESGLNYHSARYYLPWLGRWLNSDPIGIGDGLNTYGYVRGNPISLIDESGTNGKKKKGVKAKVNDVVPYKDRIKDRKKVGSNVQKDHSIAQEKIKIMRTDPDGKVHYSPKKDPSVVVETGKASGSSPAKPHTKKTFHDPQADVKEIKRLKGEGIKSISGDIVSPSRNASIRSGIKPESVDKAIWGQLDNLFSSQRLKDTAKTVKKFGTKVAKSIPGLGTAIGIGVGISLLAQGDVWGATKEFAAALPFVGEILDIIDIGSSIFGWIFGGGKSKKKSKGLSKSEINELINKDNSKDLEGWNIIAVTPEWLGQEGGGNSAETKGSEDQEPRLIDLGAGKIGELRISPKGGSTGIRLFSAPPSALQEIWKWDEYLLLEMGAFKVKPTPQGPAAQISF